MKWLALIAVGLFFSSTAQGQQVQELHYGNGYMLWATCKMPDAPNANFTDQVRCIMQIDGLIGGIAYRANKEGICLFDTNAIPELEKVRKELLAWFELNKHSGENLERPEAEIVEEVLMKVYPCK
ncbi:MAG: hypothetical protein HYU58_09005 [Proteobacteria bacterium]|nr:hypothetical protein [Pseudomonadota bacterium]